MLFGTLGESSQSIDGIISHIVHISPRVMMLAVENRSSAAEHASFLDEQNCPPRAFMDFHFDIQRSLANAQVSSVVSYHVLVQVTYNEDSNVII